MPILFHTLISAAKNKNDDPRKNKYDDRSNRRREMRRHVFQSVLGENRRHRGKYRRYESQNNTHILYLLPLFPLHPRNKTIKIEIFFYSQNPHDRIFTPIKLRKKSKRSTIGKNRSKSNNHLSTISEFQENKSAKSPF